MVVINPGFLLCFLDSWFILNIYVIGMLVASLRPSGQRRRTTVLKLPICLHLYALPFYFLGQVKQFLFGLCHLCFQLLHLEFVAFQLVLHLRKLLLLCDSHLLLQDVDLFLPEQMVSGLKLGLITETN